MKKPSYSRELDAVFFSVNVHRVQVSTATGDGNSITRVQFLFSFSTMMLWGVRW